MFLILSYLINYTYILQSAVPRTGLRSRTRTSRTVGQTQQQHW